jgi:hypothetical protein
MFLLGFGHKARQGKNTAALAFLELCPIDSNAGLFAFGEALKKEVKKACLQYGGADKLIAAWKESGLMPDWVHHEYGKERTLYQWWGTNFRRAQDERYWLKKIQKTFDASRPDVALITDVRFPNEAEYVHSLGGILVKVTRTAKPDVLVPEHPSEQALDGYTGWDFELIADSVKDLEDKTRQLYRELKKGRRLWRL